MTTPEAGMLPPVRAAVEDLRRVFAPAAIVVETDGSGGAYVIVDAVDLGPLYRPATTWIGAHLSPQLPYADVYPLYIGDVLRADGQPHQAPVTGGHAFRGRPAIQVSRRSNRFDPLVQTPALKFQKVIHYLRTGA